MLSKHPLLKSQIIAIMAIAALSLGQPSMAENEASEYDKLIEQGGTKREAGQFKEALGFYQKAAEAAHTDGDTLSEAKALCNVGVCYGGIDDPANELEILQKALKLARKAKSSKVTSTIYNNLADCYSAKKDFPQAIQNASGALKSGIAEYGEDSSDVAVYRCTLAEAYIAAGTPSKALPLLMKGKARFEKNLPDEARELAECFTDIGNVYIDQKRFIEAESSFKSAIETFDKYFPDGNLRKAKTLQAMAKLLRLVHRDDEADKAAGEAAKLHE